MDNPTQDYTTASQKDTITFNVVLFCTKTNYTTHKTISFPGDEPPTTIKDIKEKIEEHFSIPSCLQTLSYDAYQLSNDALLETARIRAGDTFHISYSAEADCEGINTVVMWFIAVSVHLHQEDPTLSNMQISEDFEELLSSGINDELMETLAFKYLFPWLDVQKYANRLYFVSCGGLDLVMSVYNKLHSHKWEETLLKLKYVEYGILRILWNLSETFELRRLIISHNNGLKLCIQSLLRQTLVEGEIIQDHTDMQTHRNNSWVLVENICAALGLLCNLSELPECHLEIASNQECLEQLTCISLTPSVRIMSVQLVATIFLCVAYTPQTHPLLARSLLIRRLLNASDKCRTFENDDESDDGDSDKFMLRYFTQVFLAQIILASPQHIPEEFRQQIHDFMNDFLKTATYQSIAEGEIKQWNVWSTFIPYIKLVYLPEPQGNGLMGQLHMLSLQTILLSLQNMLSRENHKVVLHNEGLEDYITCISSYVPESLMAEAKELVKIVGHDTYLQPPKLINLVKAKLAKIHFGLVDVMNMTVGEIINKVLPYS